VDLKNFFPPHTRFRIMTTPSGIINEPRESYLIGPLLDLKIDESKVFGKPTDGISLLRISNDEEFRTLSNADLLAIFNKQPAQPTTNPAMAAVKQQKADALNAKEVTLINTTAAIYMASHDALVEVETAFVADVDATATANQQAASLFLLLNNWHSHVLKMLAALCVLNSITDGDQITAEFPAIPDLPTDSINSKWAATIAEVRSKTAQKSVFKRLVKDLVLSCGDRTDTVILFNPFMLPRTNTVLGGAIVAQTEDLLTT
jgi:hypothetical protein